MQIPKQARITTRPAIAPKGLRRPAPAQAPAPVLKWVGGKGRLLSELSQRMPRSFGRYFEPFVGGGALFFRTQPKKAVLSDFNPDLINVYKCVAWEVEKVARKLAAHKRAHCEEHYYQVREKFNARSSRQTPIDRAAQFLYMNKTCFNGLYRVNKKGSFNVPMGRYKNPGIYDLACLKAASFALKRAELSTGHYREILTRAKAGDFVYFDPPYHPLTATSNFTSYTKSAFGPDDQRELADVATTLAKRGCAVLLSNSDTPFIRELFPGWEIDTVMCGRSINSKSSSRGAVAEVMIRNPL